MYTDSTDKITGEAIAETYRTMRETDNRIRERNASRCLIPRNNGNGGVAVDCKRDTQQSHTIQEAVLKRIASGNPPSVITFMPIATELLANASKAGNGELWSTLPWDLDSLPLKPEPVGTASTRHFSCNPCDSATFRQIEHIPIAWPDWPERLVVDELQADDREPLLSHQLFLLAYRCLIKEVSLFRGLMELSLLRLGHEEIDPQDRTSTERNYQRHKWQLEKPLRQKTKFDRRITKIAQCPMAHHIVPVKPAFPMASANVAGVDAPNLLKYATVTIYPERYPTDGPTDELRHWMVVSAEAGHAWSMQSFLDEITRHALTTFESPELSARWTVDHIRLSGFDSVFGQPDGYMEFKELQPEAAQAIESMMIDSIRGTRQRGWFNV